MAGLLKTKRGILSCYTSRLHLLLSERHSDIHKESPHRSHLLAPSDHVGETEYKARVRAPYSTLFLGFLACSVTLIS